MRWLPDRYQKLRSLLSGHEDVEPDIEEEFRTHVELRVEENLARGLSPDAARREAEQRMGDVTRWKKETREAEVGIRAGERRRERLGSLLREIAHAVRALLRRPGFSLPALLTLALGIGATTAGFAVLYRVVLRPLPYPDANRLVWVDSPVPAQGADEAWGLSVAGYFEFRKEATTLDELGGYAVSSVSLTGAFGALRVRAASVQASLLRALSARPALGRIIERGDDDPSAVGNRAVVLSYGFWRREFGGDRGVVGRVVRIEDEPSVVVGVMEPGFQLPDGQVDVWVPLYLDPNAPAINSHWMSAIGRLREGATISAAQTQLDGITRRFPELFPHAYSHQFMDEYGFRTRVQPLAEHVVEPDVRRSLWIVMAGIGLVLLIACANVANLLLVRAEGRRREAAVRAALGASRRQQIGHAMTESLLLTLAGAAAGCALAAGALHLLISRAPSGLPRAGEVGVGWPAIVFAALLAVLLGISFGVFPHLAHAVRYSDLREGVSGITAGRSKHGVRRAIVVAQVALAVVLLAAASLMVRSVFALRTVDPGFEARNALAFQLSLPRVRYNEPERAAGFLHNVIQRLDDLPGVEAVGAGQALPLSPVSCAPAQGEAQAPDRGGSPPCTDKQQVSPGFFSALGIHLQGRAPTWTELDAGAGEAVVTEALAQRLWPAQDPIGKGVRGSGSRWYHVVGVAQGLRAHGLDAPPAEAVFYPLVPIHGAPLWGGVTNPIVIVRTSGAPNLTSLVSAIQQTLKQVDPTVPLGRVQTLEQYVATSPSMVRRSFMMTLMGVVGVMALLLSVVGIYGVVSYTVGQRTGELGVRRALGAQVRHVLGLVLRDALVLSGLGVALGLAGAWGVTRGLQSLLYGVSATDPLSFGVAAGLLLVMSLAASWVPAHRATRIPPTEALRAE